MQNKYIKGIIASIVFFGLSLVLFALSDVYAQYDKYEILLGIASIGITVAPILFIVMLIKGIKNRSKYEKSVKATALARYYVPTADYYAIDKEFRKLNSDSGIKDKDYHIPNADRFTLMNTTATHDMSYPCEYYYEIQMSKADGKLYFVQIERIYSGEERGLVKYNAIPIGYDAFKKLCGFLKEPTKELSSLNENNWKQFLAKYGILSEAIYLTQKSYIGAEISYSSFGQSSSFYWYVDQSQNNYVIEFTCGNAGFGIFIHRVKNEIPTTDLKKLREFLYRQDVQLSEEYPRKSYIIKMDKDDYFNKLANMQNFCSGCHKEFKTDVYSYIYYYDMGVYCKKCFFETCKIDDVDDVYVIKTT